MTDLELERRIDEYTGMAVGTIGTASMHYPAVETFTTREEAERRELEMLSEESDRVTLMEGFRGTTNAAMHILVRDGGRVKPFVKARPAEAAEVERILTSTPPVRLYSFSLQSHSFTPKFRELLAAYRAQQSAELRKRILHAVPSLEAPAYAAGAFLLRA